MELTTDNQTAPTATATAVAHPLVDTVATLAARGADGVLRLGPRGAIWFAQGHIVLAEGPSSPDLAKVLVDADLGEERQLRALIDGRRRDDALGAGEPLEQLLDQRPDVHHLVDRLLHEYKLTALFEMLVPGDIQAEFAEGVVHPLGPRFGEHAVELLDKATRRMELWRRIAARIPSTTAVFSWAPDLPQRMESRLVTNDEWRYLAQLNGRQSVAEVINATGDSAFRVCSALYRLVLEGLIEECSTD
ncbi:MAG: hypothetical protein AAGA59_02690 [Actinomycetota bacterium]